MILTRDRETLWIAFQIHYIHICIHKYEINNAICVLITFEAHYETFNDNNYLKS